MYPLSEKSYEIASIYHHGLSHGNRVFLEHLREVAGVLKEFNFEDENLIAAAYLHDVLEDTSCTLAYLEKELGPRVAELVDAVTDGPGNTREQQKKRPYKLIPQTPGALTIKLADRIANMRYSLKMNESRYMKRYIVEHTSFVAHLYDTHDDVNRQMWIYLNSLVKEAEILLQHRGIWIVKKKIRAPPPAKKWMSYIKPHIVVGSSVMRFLQFLGLSCKVINCCGIILCRDHNPSPRFIRHQTIHFYQQLELLFIFYWILYSFFWISRLWRDSTPHDPSQENPFECEAFLNDHDKSYLFTRSFYSWRHFL
jgi:hypothetical protein